MKSILLATVAVASLGLALPAAAADMPQRVYTKAPVMAPMFSWGGFYIGAHVGYGWGEERDDLSDFVDIPADKFDVDGVIGGVHVGYNWQAGNIVFGWEGDFDGSGIKGSDGFDQGEAFDGTLSMKSHWQASFRGRLGVTSENWLFYATGGVAFADVKSHLNFLYNCGGICTFDQGDKNILVGWTVGGGIEHAFTPNWIGRIEARYTDYGSETFNLSGTDFPEQSPGVKFDFVSVTAGLSYKF
jgi:outer membrane immunogenic protein